MNAQFKNCLIATAITAFAASFVAVASAQSYLDGSSKARGDFGQMNRSYSQPMYRLATPNVALSYSYEPAPATSEKAKVDNKAKSNIAPKASPAPNTSTRSYSYEPGAVYSAPVRSRTSSTPLYLVPKALR